MYVYGCVYGGKRYVLGVVPEGGHEEGPPRARHVVLAGSMVAYESGEYGPAEVGGGEEEHTYVIVGNLKTVQFVHKVPSGVPQVPVGKNDVGAGAVRAIVLKADGAVAWIAEEEYDYPRISFQVRALDRKGERLLALGEDIAPGSLALAGSTVYWTQEGKPHSASLE